MGNNDGKRWWEIMMGNNDGKQWWETMMGTSGDSSQYNLAYNRPNATLTLELLFLSHLLCNVALIGRRYNMCEN